MYLDRVFPVYPSYNLFSCYSKTCAIGTFLVGKTKSTISSKYYIRVFSYKTSNWIHVFESKPIGFSLNKITSNQKYSKIATIFFFTNF